MIRQLVKADAAWRILPRSVAAGAVAGLLLPREWIGMIACMTWMPWLQCRPEQHAAPLHTALPVRARDLFLARFLALLSVMWLPLAAALAMFVVTGRPRADRLTLVELGAAAMLVMLGSQSSRVRQVAAWEFAPTVAVALLVAVAWPATHFLRPSTILVVCAVLSAGLFWNIWRQLPEAFEVLPSKDRPASPETRTTVTAIRRDGASADVPRISVPALAAWRPILRSLIPWRSLFFLPMMMMQVLTGNWFYIAMFSVFGMATSLRSAWPLGLPVRRGTLLAVAVTPWLAVMLAIPALHPLMRTRDPFQMNWTRSNRITELKLPLEYWSIGQAPEIRAPWGESWQPKTEHVLGIPVYNPYSIAPENSPRFYEWQFRRATTAIYGQPIEWADYRRVRPTVKPLIWARRISVLNLAACACWVMLLTNLLLAGLHWRVQRLTKYGVQALGAVFLLQLILMFTVDLAPGTGWRGSGGDSLVNVILFHAAAILPASLALAAPLALVPFALLCWSALRLMKGIEIPPADPMARA